LSLPDQNKTMNTFDPTTHTYKINGIAVPSVTQVIEKTLGISFKADDWYLQRGQAIHACAKFIAEGKAFHNPDTRIDGYVRALRKFFNQVEPEVFVCEESYYSERYKFAGTMDLIARINKKLCILDYKNSFEKERLKLQLGGYSVLHMPGNLGFIKTGYGVKLNDNGTYSMTTAIDLKSARSEFLVLRSYLNLKDRINGKDET